MAAFFTEILYRPIFNLLIWFYNVIPGLDLGLAIIALTVVIKIILYPLNRKMIVSQRAMQKIQPQMEEMKEKHKDNREKLGAAMMELYKKEKVNPFSSCLPLLVQLPILIAVFQVFRIGLGDGQFNFDLLYNFVANPGEVKTIAFGFLNLAERSIPLAVLAGAAQYWQSKMLMNKRNPGDIKKGSTVSAMNKQMLYFMPLFTVFIGASFPAGLTLYWFLTTALSIAQQAWMFKKKELSPEA